MKITPSAIRTVAQHSRLHWFLPLFVLVLAFYVLVEMNMATPDLFQVRFWGALAVGFLVTSVVVFVFRMSDREFLRELEGSLRKPPLMNDPRLGRFEVEVGLFLVRASFLTPFRHVNDPRRTTDMIIANVLTFFLGWWSLTGLFRTPMVLVRNFKGGVDDSARDVFAALSELSA